MKRGPLETRHLVLVVSVVCLLSGCAARVAEVPGGPVTSSVYLAVLEYLRDQELGSLQRLDESVGGSSADYLIVSGWSPTTTEEAERLERLGFLADEDPREADAAGSVVFREVVGIGGDEYRVEVDVFFAGSSPGVFFGHDYEGVVQCRARCRVDHLEMMMSSTIVPPPPPPQS